MKIKSVSWKIINLVSKISLGACLLQWTYYKLFSYPKGILLNVNTECNFNCVYCYVDRTVKTLSTKEWMDIIKQANDSGASYVGFLGGEPFLHKDLDKLLEYAAGKNMTTTIYTNGSLLNEKWFRKIRNLETQTILAIKYDCNAESYNKHTKKGNLFNKIESNIKKTVQNEIPVVTLTTLSKHNINHVKEIINRSIELGAYPVFERYVPVKNQKINEEFELHKRQWEKALKSINKTYSKVNEVLENAALLRKGFCSCFTDILSITADGIALPCPFAPPELSVGNVKKETLKEVWKNYEKRRKKWKKIPDECRTCKNKYKCGGGCKTYSYLKTGNFGKDPLCNTNIPTTKGWSAFSLIRSKLYENGEKKTKLLSKI